LPLVNILVYYYKPVVCKTYASIVRIIYLYISYGYDEYLLPAAVSDKVLTPK